MFHTKRILLSLGITGGLALASASMGQGMMGGHHRMMDKSMQCPAFGEHYGSMMHAEDVDLKAENIKNGIRITWTTTDEDKVEALQKMGQHMQQMHSKMRSRNTGNNQ